MARGRRYLWIFACGLLVIGLLGLRTGSILNHEPEVQSPSALHVVPAAGQRAVQKSLVPLKRRVYLRVADSGKEGIGSTLHHFKQSIVLARALDASLILAQSKNYVYSTSDIWNAHEDTAVDARLACRIHDHVSKADRAKLVRGWCGGNDKWAIQKMEKVRAATANCTSFMDTDDTEFGEGLTGCVMGWVRERLAPASHLVPPPAPLTFPPTRPVTVGLHIRWGDVAHHVKERNITNFFYGSMGVPNITRALRDIQAAAAPHGVQLTIAMHRAEAPVIARLNLTLNSYTLLDSPDDTDPMSDLYKLSNNDILLVGESSYGVLAHLVAPPGGITVVQLQQNRHKYENTTGFGRKLVFFQDWKPDTLQKAFSTGS